MTGANSNTLLWLTPDFCTYISFSIDRSFIVKYTCPDSVIELLDMVQAQKGD